MTTIRMALQKATQDLAGQSPTARLDAEVLLAHVLGFPRATLLAEGSTDLTAAQLQTFGEQIERRAALEPIAYLVGHKEFYGLDFIVDQRVLVPRPETELIVDLARAWEARRPPRPLLIADIGTGSGCLAVTLAYHLPDAYVYAVDLSTDALAVAQLNVVRHGVMDRVELLHGAGCAPLPQPVDLLVSNPPYTVLAEVDENVRRWEPHLALDGGGARGFDLPAHLLHEMPPHLKAGGAVFMEIAAWQGPIAQQTAQALFPHAKIAIHKDLAGLDRTLAIESYSSTGA